MIVFFWSRKKLKQRNRREKTLFQENQRLYLYGNNSEHLKVCDKCKCNHLEFVKTHRIKNFDTDTFRCIVRILLAVVSRCTTITAPPPDSSWFFFFSHLPLPPHPPSASHLSQSNSPFHPLKMCGFTCVGRLDSDLFAFHRLHPILDEVFHYFCFHYFWLLCWKSNIKWTFSDLKKLVN